VTDGQRQTAVRIALYRQQRSLEADMKVNATPYENGVEGNALWPNGALDDKPLENGEFDTSKNRHLLMSLFFGALDSISLSVNAKNDNLSVYAR